MTERSKLKPADKERVDQVFRKVEEKVRTFIGYPCNLDFDYSELFRFLKYPVNNVGDPFTSSNYKINTHEIEREVLQFFTRMTDAGEDYWGYVTSGGTEGNMYGLYLARELYPDALVYYSQDTHYSVAKILRVLDHVNIGISSLSNGEINYDELKNTIELNKDMPPIVVANIGTTMKGAIDDVRKIRSIFDELGVEGYIHCDAALSGMILPFIEGAPRFNFAAGADSFSISGHKFIGSPLPSGVVIAKRHNVDRVARAIEYVGTLDTTLTGSRSAITPLFLWYAIKRHGIEGFKKMVQGCLDVADYALTRFKEIDWPSWRNKFSTTVVFRRPSQAIVEKWQLAVQKDIAHLVVMPHVNRQWLDRFMSDFENSEIHKIAAE